jgi:tape measure domain-containing protein
MATVDDKVVAMSFESSKFESGVNTTISALDRLKAALKFPDAGKGLDDINAAAGKVDFSHISSGVDTVANRFSLLGTAAAVALGNIASKAIETGASVVKALSLDPIMAGFHNYETQINAVQTILANTGLKGASGLGQVNSVLNNLNNYANQTVYNFAEMAKNIGTFTAAGVGLKPAAESIKGIANLAAMSGSSSEQASNAMYQLSQAIAAGQVHLQDWNSVVNAGMGGKVFQEALFNTAKAMGKITDSPVGQTFKEWEKAGNSFRQSLSGAQRSTTTAVSAVAQAHKDAADIIKQATDSAAQSVENANQAVKDAQKGVADSAKSTADAVYSANEQVQKSEENVSNVSKQSAKDIQAAKDQVTQAHQGVADAAQQAASNIQAAIKAEQQAVEQSAQQVQSALDNVVQARQRLADALKPPSTDELQAAQDKLTTAQLDQADLSDAVTRAQEDQTRATQDLSVAQQKLAQVQSTTTDPTQIMMAQRAVQDAQQRVKDSADAQERALLQQRAALRGVDDAQQNLTDTKNKGTEADKNVKSAQDGLTQALKQYSDAQKQAQDTVLNAQKAVTKARQDGAKAELDANKKLIDAEHNLIDVRQASVQKEKDANRQLIDSERALTKAREDGLANQIQAADRLAKAQKDEVKTTQQAQEQITKAHEEANAKIQAAQDKTAAGAAGGRAPSWLTSDVLTSTLRQFTGDMSAAQLKAEGFTDAQIKAIQAQAKVAVGAATNVRTVSQLFQDLKEEVASAWAGVFKAVFGDINQATTLLSGIHVKLEAFLTGPVNDLAKVLQGWSKAGGRTLLIDAFTRAFHDLHEILRTVRQAFEEVFPPETAMGLIDLTRKFDNFIKSLTPTYGTLNNLKRTFEGLFAILDIGKQVLGGIFSVFGQVFGLVKTGGGSFLDLTAKIGDWLVKVDDALKKGDRLHNIFVLIGSAVSSFVTGLKNLLTGSGPVTGVFQKMGDAWDKFINSLGGNTQKIHDIFQKIVDFFGNFGQNVTQSMQGTDWTGVYRVIEVGLLGGILLTVKKFMKGFSIDFTGGLLGKAGEALEGLTGHLKALQQNVKADIILKIAISLGILAASLFALAQIPEKKLDNALTAMTIVLGELLGTVKLLDKIQGMGIKFAFISAGLIGISIAIDLLVLALYGLSKLDWPQITKGLTAIGVLLGELSLAAEPLAKNAAGMIRAGLGMIAISAALILLAHAVKEFGSMNLETLGKGLASVGIAIVGISQAAKLFPSGMVGTGLGLLAIGAGLKLLAGSISEIGHLDIATIFKGLYSIGAALIIIGTALRGFPPGLAVQGAGLFIVAEALKVLGKAIGALGGMSVDELAKGIISIGAALAVLAVGLTAMDGALPGAAALIVAAGALAILAPALKSLGEMSVGDLIIALIGLAGAITVLGIAGIALAPAAPAILAVGVALLAIGAAVALVGGGIALMGVGLSAIAVSGPAALGVLVKAFDDFITTIPKALEELAKGIVGAVKVIADAAPQIVEDMGKILDALAQAVIEAMPKIVQAFGAILVGLLQAIHDNFPKILQAGIDLLGSFLDGIGRNIGNIVDKVTNIIKKFLDALAKDMPRIVKSGAGLLESFLEGIAKNIEQVAHKAGDVLIHFVTGIGNNLFRLVGAAGKVIAKFLLAIGSAAKQIIDAGGDMVIHIIKGIGDKAPKVIDAAVYAFGKFVHGLQKGAVQFADDGAKAFIDFLNGMANTIRKNTKPLIDAGWNLASAIVDGMAAGIKSLGKKIYDVLPGPIKKALDIANSVLGIFSPSRVMYKMGVYMVQGFVNGITDNADKPGNAVQDMMQNVVDTVNAVPDIFMNMGMDQPTITPVVDLSEVEKGAQAIGGIFADAAPPVIGVPVVDTSQLGVVGGGMSSDQTAGTTVNYTQNNYSPDALSEVDIYRQTNNQLSQLASAVGAPVTYPPVGAIIKT